MVVILIMSPININFDIEKKIPGQLGRAGKITTPHGVINTPAFIVVGTKATVKAVTPEQVKSLGAECVLANTYHLYLEPGDELIKTAGGLHKFMNWSGPTMTDSGGFQVFSLGAAYGLKLSKLGELGRSDSIESDLEKEVAKLAKIDDDGVTFQSHIDGSQHRLTPEKSIAIQHNIGADIIFAFDECTAPTADYDYQKQAMQRTHAWAERSLAAHQKNKDNFSRQALFGIVQGGRFPDLRQESAKAISAMDFAGFGIGGSFDKEDLDTAVGWVNAILPAEKPRHLLGIGEPEDLFVGIENGVDTFDCVLPTRIARNGTFQTKRGRLNIGRSEFRQDLSSIENDCQCYACANYSKAYIAHLFRAKEMLAATLASIHNLYFSVNLVKNIRQSILDGKFNEYKEEFLRIYKKN